MRTRLAAALALFFALAVTSTARAHNYGIYDFATPSSGGCGNCHSGLLPNPSPAVKVLILLDNTPIDQLAGYQPGHSYAISIWVLSPKIPFAGFNLQVSAGTLASKDDSSQTQALTECGFMAGHTYPQCYPGVSGSDCGVKVGPGNDCPVFDLSNAECHQCNSTADPTVCRPCDDVTLVDIQATHTLPALTSAKVLPTWDLTWTAPNPGAGDVSFYAAGNSVDGAGNATLDHWNFLEPNPVVLHQAGGS